MQSEAATECARVFKIQAHSPYIIKTKDIMIKVVNPLKVRWNTQQIVQEIGGRKYKASIPQR